MSDDLRLTPTDIIDAKKALYTLLDNFTTGRVKKAFRRRKVRGVFEQYKKVYYAGMRITPKSLFHEKGSVWKVVEATWERVEDAIDEWEAKLEFLEEHGRYNMSEDDRVHGLLEIIAADLRVKLLE